MMFRAVLEQHGKTATGFHVPDEVVASLGPSRKPAVVATVNGHSWRTSIAFMGGEFLLGVPAAQRAACGIEAGQELEVEVVLDTAPRDVEVPADLAAALDVVPGARAAFDRLSFSHRKEHVRAIEEAKAAETRQRRIVKTVEKVTPG